MANGNGQPPLVTLTEESKKNLAEMEAELQTARDNLEALKGLGLDTSALEQKVVWAEKARNVILQQLQAEG